MKDQTTSKGLVCSGLLVPILAFLVSKVVLVVGASLVDVTPWSSSSYSRFDSGHYLSIARSGYELISCRSVPGYDPTAWCGNAGWMPGYPLALILLSRLIPGNLELLGVVLSNVCFVLVLYIAWRWVLGPRLNVSSTAALLLLACFPGSIYQHTIFPISMFGLCLFATVYYLSRCRWLAAGAVGGLGAFTYSTGFLLLPIACVSGLLRGAALKTTWFRWFLGCALIGCGFLATFAVFHLSVGHWDAFFKIQAKYGHSIHSPFATFTSIVGPGLNFFVEPKWEAIPSLQTLLVGFLVVLFLLLSMLRYAMLTSIDVVVLLTVLAYWLFPLMMGSGVSLYRAESLLFPLAVVTRHFSPWVTVTSAICCIVLGVGMAALFFKGILV